MLVYALVRILYTIPILLGVSLIAFGLIHLVPGNPLDLLLPPEAPKELVDQIKAKYGFDQPLYIQYFTWLGRVAVGDLGNSVFTGEPVREQLISALSNTLVLAIPAAVLGFALGIFLGAVAGFNRDTWIDKLASAIAITGVSMPHYWGAIVSVILFSVILNWLPATGMGPSGGLPQSWEDVTHMILPVATLSLIPMGVISRLVRATVLEINGQEFTAALRGKGLRRKRIIYHVLKNAAPPAMALMGLQFGYLLGGSILVETVYNWPGSGQLMNLAIFRRDIPVLQATVVVLSFFFVLINLSVDVLQAAIDPRIRR
ncbi:ABC transporter permease [Prosthecomicrobium hirschii]|uniref:ABC transporter permease n=1 Tax=Prosthecodimorpha hirschii TaxID=665126 RepID=A0A0P6VLP4_9HYPH|nr:ABC transporter permease [Prosthecomicrobium hirschii]KPL53543.1 ABC transporter permease [Prosthecomicrobium hirschii]TPQ49367.1 ABC transporter permease [Prosthecomicrobium hirschii]